MRAYLSKLYGLATRIRDKTCLHIYSPMLPLQHMTKIKTQTEVRKRVRASPPLRKRPGRKPLPEDKKPVPVGLRCQRHLRERWVAHCESKGMSQNKVFSEIVSSL